MFRPCEIVAGALALMTAACSDPVGNFINSSATIRLVNDTDTPLALTVAGVLDSANTRIAFGEASACVFVDLSTTTVPAVAVTNAVTGTSFTFTPTLTVGANLTVVAFGRAVGDVRFAALDNRFVPTTNEAGLRFFNGAPSVGSLHMLRSDVALTPSIVFGAASSLVGVPTDSASVTFSNGTSVVLDAGLMAFPLGQNSTVVIGPSASGANALRFFTVQGC